MRSSFAVALVWMSLANACSSQAAPIDDDAAGRRVYGQPVDDGNTFSCATCHALEEPADDYRRPGHPLGDAAARPSWKNGAVHDLREAVNTCLVEWMNAQPWSADDPRWLDLEHFLVTRAPESAGAIDIRIVDPPDDLSGGDPTRGRDVFDGACAVCHDEGGTGTQLAPAVAGLALDPSYVATRVRTSGRSDSAVYEELTGGVMPFWGADRLTDDELRDIVAWLAQGAVSDDATSEEGGSEDDGASESGATDGPSDGATTGEADCPTTDSRVGWVAELTTNFHGVGGLAEIVDDCTVVVHDFTFDGNGIDVRLYGGVGGDYDAGYPMTDDLVQPGGYDGILLEAVLPADRTLDDLEGVSVWCVDVGVDFGSGSFHPP